MIGCESVENSRPHCGLFVADRSRPKENAEAAQREQECRGYQRGCKPIAKHHPSTGQQVIESRRIKAKAGVTIARIGFGQPAGMEVAGAERIVERKREAKMIREVAAGRHTRD